MRSAAALASVLALAGSLTACGASRRDRVNDYVKAANAIQEKAAPEFARADAAYKKFSANKLAKSAPADLERAESAMRDTRDKLSHLDPPPDARRLHKLLLHVFDLDIGLAHETTQMAEYLPAASDATKPLKRVNTTLQKGLGSSSVATQTRTLREYHDELDKVVASLRRLDPPPILAGIHSDQLSRLEDTRTLAAQLRKALAAGDQKRVSDLLIQFRRVNTDALGGITQQALLAYEGRQQDVSRATQAVQREQNRLAATLK